MDVIINPCEIVAGINKLIYLRKLWYVITNPFCNVGDVQIWTWKNNYIQQKRWVVIVYRGILQLIPVSKTNPRRRLIFFCSVVCIKKLVWFYLYSDAPRSETRLARFTEWKSWSR